MHSDLKIKPVGLEYIDQYNELLRYVFQVTNQQLIDSGYDDGEIIRSKRPILQKADVFGWFNTEDELVSQVCIYPCSINIHGTIFDMGGVTGVGTYPEYAGKGLMSELIKLGLEKMREKKQWISCLYPYSIPYYRLKGWEIMSDYITFELTDSHLPKQTKVPGYVERLAIDEKDIIETYNIFARNNHGAMIRGKMEWDEYWRWENEDERTAAVYYNSSDIPMGFMIYWINNDVFHIKEIIYLNEEARKGLWNFISVHHSMISSVKGYVYKNEPIAFVLDDSQIIETIGPYFMARIVDVAEFLKNYPFPLEFKPFHFIVKDPVAEWNQGVFGVQTHNGRVVVSNEPVGKAVELDIQTLTSMLMSYRTPLYFHKIERIKTDTETLKLLENIIPIEQPYFSDYF